MTNILMTKAMMDPIQTGILKIKYSGRTPKLTLKDVKFKNTVMRPYFFIFETLSYNIILIAKQRKPMIEMDRKQATKIMTIKKTVAS